MTVGVSPVGSLANGESMLKRDLNLAKAALLYADHVTLCSPASTMILALCTIAMVPEDEQINILGGWLEATAQGHPRGSEILAQLKAYRSLSQRRQVGYLTHEEQRQYQWLHNLFKQMLPEIVETASQIAKRAGGEDLIVALNSERLDLHIPSDLSGRNALIGDFAEYVTQTVTSPLTFPLFDEHTSRLVRAAIDEGIITPTGSSRLRGKSTALAADLFDRLPTFEQASVEQILDIRRELEVPLTRFRVAILGFSNDILSDYWDEEFVSECQIVFIREVEPAILEIDEATKSNRYLRKLIHHAARGSALAAAGALLGMFVAHSSSQPEIVTQAIGLTLPAAGLAFSAREDQKHEQKDVEQHQLYFYYQARKRLRS